VRTAPVRLGRAGIYGFREVVDTAPFVSGVTTPCALREETALAAPRIVTGRGDVARFVAAGGGRSRPVRIRIASLGVDAPVTASGIDVRNGVLGIPADIHRTGWWRDGAAPGDGNGAVLVAGHVDSAAGGVGAFFSLRNAAAGASVEVVAASGRTFAYRVESVRTYPKSALPPSVFDATGRPRLVLVTCGGTFDPAAGHYPDDVVLTAVPAR